MNKASHYGKKVPFTSPILQSQGQEGTDSPGSPSGHKDQEGSLGGSPPPPPPCDRPAPPPLSAEAIGTHCKPGSLEGEPVCSFVPGEMERPMGLFFLCGMKGNGYGQVQKRLSHPPRLGRSVLPYPPLPSHLTLHPRKTLEVKEGLLWVEQCCHLLGTGSRAR